MGARAWSPLLPLPTGGAPHQPWSPGQAQGESQGEASSPRKAWTPEPPRAHLGSLLESRSQRALGPTSSPPIFTAQALPCPDAVTVHIVDRIPFM